MKIRLIERRACGLFAASLRALAQAHSTSRHNGLFVIPIIFKPDIGYLCLKCLAKFGPLWKECGLKGALHSYRGLQNIAPKDSIG